MQIVYKTQRKITKELVELLPYFVKSTIETIELLTGIEAKKEKPEYTEIEIDTNKNYVSSSIGFYGDVDGLMILIFAEELSKNSNRRRIDK
ncbi:hypothetical protein [Lebetimonas sp. JS085]|nr:hypothetical protein [Lebetimonas sp. JS085]